MSRRIDIELTSARPDGTWTWRAAGAREPKGVLDGQLLPNGSIVGATLRAEAEYEMEGIEILSVTDPKARAERSGLLEMIESNKPFESVTQQLAKRDRNDRSDGGRRDRPTRDRPNRDRPSRDRPAGDRPAGDRTGTARDRSDPKRSATPGTRGPRDNRGRPNFTAPPELPQRPKPKRLKPGRTHRNTVLAELPEQQRPVAERALQGGIPAVRQAVNEQNARLKAEGHDEIPAAGMLSMAESLLPKLRVAEWLDRADAAKADLEELDLRDLRSVVAASDDPMVARDESTRVLAAELKQGLAAKQEKELQLWFGDIDAAIGVGRIVRALKLSSQPPKAGVRFPVELSKKLSESTTTTLSTDSLSDRWAAVLEAVAFSPIRTQVVPTAVPPNPSDELLATVKRLAPLLPQVAALFGIDVAPGVSAPRPLRPSKPGAGKKPAGAKRTPPPPPPKAPVTESPTPVTESPTPVTESPTPVTESPTPVTESPTPVTESPTPVEQAASDD